MTNEPDRVIDLSVEVPGSPEQVWRAIATGPGISSWFVGHDVEERVGGTVTMDFGSYGTHSAEVVDWDPPRRVVFGSGGDRPLAYEWLVQDHGGGTCVVRLVNSGFGHGQEWDADYDGMSEGWKVFLQNLRLHLTHFPGRTARPVLLHATAPGPNEDAFAVLCDGLGVATGLAAGDRLATTGAGVPTLSGRLDASATGMRSSHYLLVLDEPAPGTAFLSAEGSGEQVMISLYLYLYGDVAPDTEEAWTALFAERFPSATPAT